MENSNIFKLTCQKFSLNFKLRFLSNYNNFSNNIARQIFNEAIKLHKTCILKIGIFAEQRKLLPFSEFLENLRRRSITQKSLP